MTRVSGRDIASGKTGSSENRPASATTKITTIGSRLNRLGGSARDKAGDLLRRTRTGHRAAVRSGPGGRRIPQRGTGHGDSLDRVGDPDRLVSSKRPVWPRTTQPSYAARPYPEFVTSEQRQPYADKLRDYFAGR